jgi:hypothetical protein
MPKPLHPVVNKVLHAGLGIAARGTARFLDSVLGDMASAFRKGEKRVQKVRSNIHQKVVESEIGYPEEE